MYIIIFFQDYNFECFKSPFINHQMVLLQSFQVCIFNSNYEKKKTFLFHKINFQKIVITIKIKQRKKQKTNKKHFFQVNTYI